MGDFDFLSREKRGKWMFLTFPKLGNAVFECFYFSQGWETRFLDKNGRFTPVSEQNHPIFDDLLPYLNRITQFFTIYSRIRAESPDF